MRLSLILLALLPVVFPALSGAMTLKADPDRPPAASQSTVAISPAMLAAQIPRRPREIGWDAGIDGGFGRLFPDGSSHRWTGFGRARLGALYDMDPVILAVDATYDVSNLETAVFGLQVQMINVELGFWARAGFQTDLDPHPGFMAGLGWSLFGIEVQGRAHDGASFAPAIYGTLSVPIGVINLARK